MRPRPSDDPVMNTRATSYLLSSRRPFRLTIPNDLPASRVFPCTRHDAGEKVYAIQEEEGRPEEQHLQHWFALKQKSTPPPSRRLMQPQQRACRRYSRRDWSAARLVKVSAIPMSALVPKEKRHRTDLGTKVKSDATLIRVETDNGLTGIGAALGTPPIVAAMVTGPFRRVCETRRERNGKSPVSPTHIR
jgi:hypothetical protein